jgi:hypothetical protein
MTFVALLLQLLVILAAAQCVWKVLRRLDQFAISAN